MHLSSSARNKYNPGITETDPNPAAAAAAAWVERGRAQMRISASRAQALWPALVPIPGEI
jgi:hypothetical protein